ncbi:helix-turn-helix domain-containing protein [Ornithinimicrobium sp. F0845]|uniref:winged helix-turn-helix domain-containing protein n=1 Tax=Ornithinimicrobium sp. F0845 TaxID=2926412 RepID=UPI001FF2E0D6|nr:helix-turn-helix domain-containing protein [Ornithinimicrobium sp. F0845]MCK0112451.1 helix-turn-helix domain-containing protein [Ornithinimicrobium sp. F0845]
MVERKTPVDASSANHPPYLAPAVDATAMKAFAHPLRMAMYDYLNDHGSATATMLARHTGENTGQTSYHLRQLERHGFVTEDVGRGTGRERWWKAVGFSMNGYEMAKDSSTRPAIEATLRRQVAQRAEALADWFERSVTEDPEWAARSLNSRVTAELTLDEATALGEALMTLLHEHSEAAKRGREAEEPGASTARRRVRIYLDAFPLAADDD